VRILPAVSPSPEQLAILGDSGPGVRLIRGAAGSGKTTTSLLRLRQLCRSRAARRERLGLEEPVRVLVLTYNRTLEGYIAELARSQMPHTPGVLLEVSTFSRWARQLVPDDDILDRGEAAALLGRLLPGVVQRSDLVTFFVDEVEYALSRFTPDQMSSYLTVRRDGRGTTPRVERSLRERLLDEVVAPYTDKKSELGVMDWNDLAVATISAPSPAYDVVIVDEAQDFSANQVRAVLSHVHPDHSTTFVLDAIQRIYPRYFTWAEVGIQLRPSEIHRLRTNYRNTAEIAAFAIPLVRDLPEEDDGTIPDFTACDSHGPRPVLVAGKYSSQLKYMLDELMTRVDLTSDSVAILQPRGGGWFDQARSELRNRGIAFCELTRERDWPSGSEALGLSTIPSAKGLEFDHVLLPGLNQQVTPHGEGEGDASLDRLRRLLAMGVGRARKSVMLGYKPSDASTLIGLLDPATYDYVDV